MSIHGHAKVELFDAESKEKLLEVQKDNIVTNALKYLININVANGQNLNDMVFPIASNALGGIILFDNTLTEDPENYNLPTDGSAHIVGFAGQTVSTSSIYRGSFNEAESGRTDHGFKSVWDFGTSQANGTIKALARTNRNTGLDPSFFPYLENEYSRPDNFNDTDTYWYPMAYDGEYLYMFKFDNDSSNIRIAKARKNMLRMKVADISSLNDTKEILKSVSTSLFTFEWNDDFYSQNDANYHQKKNYSIATMSRYFNGHDGYIYAIGRAERNSDAANSAFSYFTLKYSDYSFEKSERKRVVLQSPYYGGRNDSFRTHYNRIGPSTYSYCDLPDNDNYYTVNKGKAYFVTSDRNSIIICDLSTPANQTRVQIFDASSPNFINYIDRYNPVNGGCMFWAYIYTENGYYYRTGIVYEDGSYILSDIRSRENGSIPNERNAKIADALTLFNYGGQRHLYSGWNAGYLGTIANLSRAVEKNASQTMKITYTLTDEDDES